MRVHERVKICCAYVRRWWASTSKVWRVLLGILVVGTPCVDSFFNLLDRVNRTNNKEDSVNVSQDQSNLFVGGDFEINSTNLFEVVDVSNNVETTMTSGITNELHFAVKKMRESYSAGEYEDAVRFARIADSMLTHCDNHDMAVVADHVAIKSILMEEAFFNKEYDKVLSLHHELQTLGENRYVATRPPQIALEMVSGLLKSGKRMFFFSPSELGNFRKWDKAQLQEVFSCLAHWGYIQPIMIDVRAKNHDFFYYEDFFGFDAPLPYVMTSVLVGQTSDDHEIYSNEVSVQWRGRKLFEEVDIDKCVSDELNLEESESYIRGMHISIEFNKEEPSKGRIHYTLDKDLPINTNIAFEVKHRSLWKSGMTLSNIKNPIFLTKSHLRTINHIVYRIPPQMWFVVVMLLIMAFSTPLPPNNEKENLDKEKIMHDDIDKMARVEREIEKRMEATSEKKV